MAAVVVLTMHDANAQEWRQADQQDNFGRVTKAIRVEGKSVITGRGRITNREAILIIRPNDAYIVTGDSHICHMDSNPVRLAFQVDKGKVIEGRASSVSTDSTAVFIGQSTLQSFIAAKEEIKVETRDFCGATAAMNFSARGLSDLIKHVRPSAPTTKR
jgi:hypothetical protein